MSKEEIDALIQSDEHTPLIDNLTNGYVLIAKKIKRYMDILIALDLPEPIITAAVTAYCAADSHFECEIHLRNLAAQAYAREAQHAPKD